MLMFNKYFKDSEPFNEFGRYLKDDSIERKALMISFVSKLRDLNVGFSEIIKCEKGMVYVKVGSTVYGPDSEFNHSQLGRFFVLSKERVKEEISNEIGKLSFDSLLKISDSIVVRSIASSMNDVRESTDVAKSDLIEAKLLRAQSLGFDPLNIMYHETDPSNEYGILSEGFDLNIKKARGSDNQVPDGVFLKPNDKPIGLSDNGSQMPFLLKKGKVASFSDRCDIKSFLCRESEVYRKLSEDKESIDDTHDSEYEVLTKDLLRLLASNEHDSDVVLEVKKEIDRVLASWGSLLESNANSSRESITELFSHKGYDYIKIKNDEGSFGRRVETTIVLNPENLRSTSDKFELKESRDQEHSHSYTS